MDWVPAPAPDDVPFNEPYTADLDDGEKVTVTFTPEQSGSVFYLPVLAISKVRGTIYEVRDDGSTQYGPAAIPPTDIDDTTVTFAPAKQFRDSLEVIIRNNSGAPQTYHIQPIGFERVGGGSS
ncbi:hypothetical protein [Halobaculum lipolyticum]|uniref:Uncharacterized protein n=1 Tax=Halobaculum lipolyticum TaxID=3032001 RepID=A0ABD5W816_9EURY|nr:hypothetical protein [Halobaculum sp. DT31]